MSFEPSNAGDSAISAQVGVACDVNLEEQRTTDAGSQVVKEPTCPPSPQIQEDSPGSFSEGRGPSFSTYSRFKPSPYSVLAVDVQASTREITAQFRRLSLKYHPDRSELPREEAEEKFKKLNEAYQLLKDEQKRREWDAVWPSLKVQELKERCTRVRTKTTVSVLKDGQLQPVTLTGLANALHVRPTGRAGVLFRNRWFETAHQRAGCHSDDLMGPNVFFGSSFGDIFNTIFFGDDEYSDGSDQYYEEYSDDEYEYLDDPFSFGFSGSSFFDVFFTGSGRGHHPQTNKQKRFTGNTNKNKSRYRSRDRSQTHGRNKTPPRMEQRPSKNDKHRPNKKWSWTPMPDHPERHQQNKYQPQKQRPAKHGTSENPNRASRPATNLANGTSASKHQKPHFRKPSSVEKPKQNQGKPSHHNQKYKSQAFESKKRQVEKLKNLLRQRKQQSSQNNKSPN